jgi:hypothetical protein
MSTFKYGYYEHCSCNEVRSYRKPPYLVIYMLLMKGGK